MITDKQIDHHESVHIEIVAEKVSCNGGGGALGHPLVWYDLRPGKPVQCKYCDRTFVRRKE